jgi:hypothetical protein
MKKVLFILAALLGTISTEATAQAASPMNTEYDKDFNGVKGRFSYAVRPGEALQVTYKLTPLSPVNHAHIMLHTPDPMPLHATVSNSKGKVVFSWRPEQMVYLYDTDWDLSTLKSGEYTVNLYMGAEKNSIHHFNFTKQ